MLLKLPADLHYPITVNELLRKPGEDVARSAPLLSYIYRTKVTEGDELEPDRQVEKAFPADYHSSVEGTLTAWKIKKGDVIVQPQCVSPPDRNFHRD